MFREVPAELVFEQTVSALFQDLLRPRRGAMRYLGKPKARGALYRIDP